MFSIVLIVVSLLLTIFLIDYVYFKLIITKSLQPTLIRIPIYRVLIYIIIVSFLYLSLSYSYHYSIYLVYIVLAFYLTYALYRYNFYRKSTNILQILRNYKKINFANKVRVITGKKELDDDEQLKLIAKWYFRRWRFDETDANMNVDLIFDSSVKPTNIHELISQIFVYGHLANNQKYLSLSYDSDKMAEESDLIDKLYNKVFKI